MTEAGVAGVEMMGWFAAFVPTATPKPVVDTLNTWFNTVLKTEDAKTFLNSYGGDPFISTPEEGQALLLKQIKEWQSHIQTAGIEKQ